MNFPWIKTGSIFMFIAVALGAFGAHALRGKIDAYYLEIFKTGVLYQFIHALALIAVGWLVTQADGMKVHYAGLLFILGIILFSGSLYLLAITEVKWLGAVTPLGGLAFLGGWFFLASAKYF